MKLLLKYKIINLLLCMKLSVIKILILILFSSIFAEAQIILTSEYNPAVGDAHILKNADEGEIDPGPSGANQFWDFSYVKTGFDSVSTFYILKCTTPYGAYFDRANLASHDGKNNYKYYNTAETFFQYLGSGDTNKVIVFIDPILNLQYPFSYGDSFLDSFFAITPIGQYQIKKFGIRFVIGDGYGNIRMPYDTIFNVLRVKSTEFEIDSVFLNDSLISVVQSVDTSYFWYKSNYKFPIMVINFSYAGSSSYRYVGFVEKPYTVGIQVVTSKTPENFVLYQNYPNPFNPETNILYDIPENTYVRISIFNVLGQEIRTLVNEFQRAGSYRISFNGADLPSGVYFYSLQTEKFSNIKKMILIK